jgi:hypothetical protein
MSPAGWTPLCQDAWFAGFAAGEASFSHCSQPPRRGAPQLIWTVAARGVLERLVAYFERFPLRAKKQQQFEAWRERWRGRWES